MQNLLETFSVIPDFRRDHNKLHSLTDIIFISICAFTCGCEDYASIHYWALDNQKWLKRHIELTNGVPSDDTLRRVFRFLDYDAFSKCFIDFTQNLCELTNGEVVAFDGKCLRGSKDKNKDYDGLYLMGAWATSNKLLLGQLVVDEKSNRSGEP